MVSGARCAEARRAPLTRDQDPRHSRATSHPVPGAVALFSELGVGVGRYVVSEPLVRGAAPTGRHRHCRCCRVAARSWLRPPTADSARRERSLRSYSSAPASTRRGSRRHMPQRPMQQGSPNAIDCSVGSRREESAPVAFRLRRAAACSDGGQRPKPGPSLHMRGTVRCLRPLFRSR